MYEYFRGKLIEKNQTCLVIEVQGIGYKIFVPLKLFAKLPNVGEAIFLYVSWIVREMSQTLYGFDSREERELFELMLTVSGIGPKTALSIVGHFELADLETTVYQADCRKLCQVPGVGKKTAERLIVDLKDKLKVSHHPQSLNTKFQDAVHALLNLGCPQLVAEQTVKKAASDLPNDCDLSSLITTALRYQRS